MAIKKENKFDNAVAELNEQEAIANEKSQKVLKTISGGSKTKMSEKRKTMPVYIPETLYEQFDAITTAYGKSNNSAIVELIRDYVTQKKNVLDEI